MMATGHRRGQRGVTLIELMIALVLGLILIITLVSAILAGRQSYRTNEALAQVQEGARISFELLAREIRQAGVTGCGNGNRIANTLNPVAGNWWAAWVELQGFDGATATPAVAFGVAPGERVAGTDAIMLQGVSGNTLGVANHDTITARFTLNAVNTDFVAGDILVACDIDHATIFQATGVNAAGIEIDHATGAGAPGNCSRGLGFPTACDAGPGNAYRFGTNAQLARLGASVWYIGNNGRAADGGRSLYRARLAPGGGVGIEEIVSGVSDLQLEYREAGDDTLNPVPALWDEVNAVELTLTFDSTSNRVALDPTVNEGRLQRTFTTLIGLRNRAE
jgi:type IV pilus assembly protein PilW